MKRSRFQLPLRHRSELWKLMSFALITVLSLQPLAFANTRSVISLLKVSDGAAVASAPLGLAIEVNSTSDGDNLNPSAGCDVPGRD